MMARRISLRRSPQTIQALERGLSVLTAINELSPASLSRLVDATALPKATVVRVLHTLRAAGYVELAENAGYRLLPRVRELFSSLDHESAPTQTIRRLLNDFATVVKWPAEFLVREGATMVIEASNRDIAPITLKRFEHIRFPLLTSASGIAVMAWSRPRQREEIMAAALAQVRSGDGVRIATAVRQEMAAAIRRGYAIHDYDTPIEGTRAIAVPVYAANSPVAAVALIFLRDAVPHERVDQFLFPRLRELSFLIGQSYVEATA